MPPRPPKPPDQESTPRRRRQKSKTAPTAVNSPRPRGKSRRTAVSYVSGFVDDRQQPTPLTDAYLIHHKLVGRLVIAWASLEGTMQQLIWTFLNLSMSDGRIITSRFDAASLIPILRALGIRLLISEKLQDFLDHLATIDGYRNDRKFVVHGTWMVLPRELPAAMSLRPEAEAGGVITETFTPRRLQHIINETRDVNRALLILEDEIKHRTIN